MQIYSLSKIGDILLWIMDILPYKSMNSELKGSNSKSFSWLVQRVH